MSIRRLKGMFVVLTLLASICTIEPQAAAPHISRTCQSMWTVNLPQRPSEKSKKLLNLHQFTLKFVDDDSLMVSETSAASSRANMEQFASYRRSASFLDADSGNPLFTKEWETRANDSYIEVTYGGLLLRTGSDLRFYSRHFELIQQLHLSTLDPNEAWFISVSSSGKTILLNHYDRKQSRLEVRDGTTFSVKRAWTETPPLRPHLYAISDSAFVSTDVAQQQLSIRDFGSTQWKTLHKFKVGCLSSPTFVDETTLATRVCNTVTVFSTQGDTLMVDQPETHESVEGETIASSRNGRALAVSFSQGKGGGLFDTDVRRIRTRVAVYDLPSKKQILNINLVPLPKQYEFALSPDGTKLAILKDRTLSMCSVQF